jgi:hypothetical protein
MTIVNELRLDIATALLVNIKDSILAIPGLN